MTTLPEDTLRLGDERDRLDAELEEIADTLAEADPGSASAQTLRQEGNDLDQQGRGVAYLIEEYGADATVTVRGLTAGDFARVEDRVAAIRQGRDGAPAQGARRNVYAAMGLVDAPFLDVDETVPEPDRADAVRKAVANQPIGVVKWLYALVDERTTVDEGNWNGFRERLRERRST